MCKVFVGLIVNQDNKIFRLYQYLELYYTESVNSVRYVYLLKIYDLRYTCARNCEQSIHLDKVSGLKSRCLGKIILLLLRLGLCDRLTLRSNASG